MNAEELPTASLRYRLLLAIRAYRSAPIAVVPFLLAMQPWPFGVTLYILSDAWTSPDGQADALPHVLTVGLRL